jgi:hypothetical protein
MGLGEKRTKIHEKRTKNEKKLFSVKNPNHILDKTDKN